MGEVLVHLRQQRHAVQAAALLGGQTQTDDGVAEGLAVATWDEEAEMLQLAFVSVEMAVDTRQVAVGVAMAADALDLAAQLFLEIVQGREDAVKPIDFVHDAA